MTTPAPIAVIDIGKTNAKVVLIAGSGGQQIASRSLANVVRQDGPYPHADTERLWDFMVDALAALAEEHGIGGISITTHGATAALMAGDELALAGWLRELPEADLVQHDAQWRQRLDTWLRFGTRVAWVLAALFGLGVLLVVGNTVRLDIQSRRGEIGVLQLLGATDGFIRRPFLYLGAWYGLGAGGLAAALLAVAGAALAGPLAELAASYGSRFALTGIDLQWTLSVLAGATALGWLGAGLVTGHFLRQTRPSGT